jgi:hydrogenase maturation factor
LFLLIVPDVEQMDAFSILQKDFKNLCGARVRRRSEVLSGPGCPVCVRRACATATI